MTTERQERVILELERALECLTAEWDSGPSGVRAQAIAHIRQALLLLKPFIWREIKPGVYVTARGES